MSETGLQPLLTDAGAAMAALATGEVSSEALTDAALARIAAADADIGAFLSVLDEEARAAARAADAARAAGRAGPLTGLPVAIKDVFCKQGTRTTAGSRMLRDWVAPYDATAVTRLEAAGAVIVGKTNMDEFAMGSSGENSHFGPTRNPWDRSRVPGGSSSGSAAAVAAGMVPLALGTDTGGSIRQPAAFCGLTGIKPTYGRISRWGMIAFASSLDQAGIMAWSAADLAPTLAVLAGVDPLDSTSVERELEDPVAHLDAPLGELRLGWPLDLLESDLDATLRGRLEDARRVYEGLGAHFVDVRLPNAIAGVPAYYVIAPAEASANLSRYDGVRFGFRCAEPADLDDMYARTRAEGFGAEVRRRILTGTFALSVGYYDAYYRKAQRIRRLIRDDFDAAFARVDAILAPVTPDVAFGLGEKTEDPVAMYQQDIFTIPASLAGLPALSMPMGSSGGLPVGAQLVGPHFSEPRLLQLAHAFQRATDHHRARPQGVAA